ncbi:hypothetical protein L1887_47143 [Cichorium endivia]|nr:hypothetical protein L1887_47143 [Cichorium endivia]
MAGFLRGGGSGGAGYGRVADGSDPYRDGRNPYTSSSASSGRAAASSGYGAGGAGYGGAGFAGAGAGGAGRTAGGAGFRAGGAGFAGSAGGAGFSGGAGGAGGAGGGAPYASEKSSARPRMGGGHLVVKCPEQLILSNCLIRGSGGAGATSAGDNVVNTLLAKLDGVEQLNNILVIGMTNRLDMIDEALLRPGRLEVHVEVSLPDEFGRRQILNIHTSKMRTNGVMDGDVNIDELAALTKNFSGAEIAGLIKSATSFAFNRHVKVGTMAGISNDVEDMKVMHQDFLNALEEVKPAFGVAEEELSQVVQNGIMHFAPHIDVILRDGHLRVEQVRTSQRTPLVTVLLHGPPGSGKTALAATIAIASDYPFIKLISPESMIGMGDAQKINYLNKVFNDAYKSPLSIVVIDNIEKIVEWVRIGPRFSNSVLQALAVLLGKRPPKDKRLLAGLGEEGKLNIGIKKLLSEIEMARLDNDPADRLASSLSSVQSSAIDVDIDVDLN